MAHRYKDTNSIEYITLKVPRISFTDIKPYLTNEVIPEAIRTYAEMCANRGSAHEYANDSVLYGICALSQKTIANSLKLFSESISGYKLKHGYSDSCESMEETMRLWERAKIKMLDEKYFDEVIVDSIYNIKSGKAKIDMSKLEPEVRDAAEKAMERITYEINNTHFLPKTDPLGRLLRGEKK